MRGLWWFRALFSEEVPHLRYRRKCDGLTAHLVTSTQPNVIIITRDRALLQEVYAVQSAQKINSLTRKHSTHAYGSSHAHVPHPHAQKPGVDLGDYSRLSPGWKLGGEFIPFIFTLFWGSFEMVFSFFWSPKGQRSLPVWTFNLLWTHRCSLPRTKRIYIIILTYPGLLRVASVSEYKYWTNLNPKLLRSPLAKGPSPQARARPESGPIGIDRITVLGKPHHPSADQKNENTISKLPQNSVKINGMNSPPNFQPGERRE